MRLVPLESVRINSYLAKTLYDIEGRVLLNEGTKINTTLIEKLRSFNIDSLYIIDDLSNDEIKNIIKPDLRNKALELINSTFKNAKISGLSDDNDEYLKSVYLLAEELLDAILSNDDLLPYLVDIRNLNLNTYNHCVNVAIISLVVGINLKLNRTELLNLATGALIHDIGKAFIYKGLVMKDAPLTYDEFELMKNHCQKGYNYIENNAFINTDIKMIILQHHERIDGLGYPNGLFGSQINKLAKIVSIADIYDMLTSQKYYIQSMCASDALEYIMSHAGTIFDFNIVKVFSKVIVPFPYGTVVRLSNGDLGIVKETFSNFPLRPNIKIIKSNIKENEGTTISLINELSIVISHIEKVV